MHSASEHSSRRAAGKGGGHDRHWGRALELARCGRALALARCGRALVLARCGRPLVLAAAGCALAIAACGGSSGSGRPGKPSLSALRSDGIRFADCMRSHGVPNFPDPSGGGGIHIQISSGIDPSSPAFQAAQSACRKLLPGGGPEGSGHPSAQALAQLLTVSKCMRAHGVAGFPDPTSSPPANIADFSVAFGRDGAFLAVPKSIDPASPAFKRAAESCGFGPGINTQVAP